MLVGKLIGREGGIVRERKIGRKKTNGKESEDKVESRGVCPF